MAYLSNKIFKLANGNFTFFYETEVRNRVYDRTHEIIEGTRYGTLQYGFDTSHILKFLI
jgi:hypothetical protein